MPSSQNAESRPNGEQAQLFAILLLGLPVALIAILYYPVLSFELIWDDLLWTARVHAHDNSYWQWLVYAFTERSIDSQSFYRPISIFTLYAQADSSNPAYTLHFGNYLLALLNTFLVSTLFFQVHQRQAKSINLSSLILCLCFTLFVVLHPSLVEINAWVSSRFEQMYLCFILLILNLQLAVNASIQRDLITGLLFFLALCAKESAVAFIIALPLLQRCLTAEAPTYRTYAALLFAFCLYMLCRYNAIGWGEDRAYRTALYDNTTEQLLVILASLGRYLQLLLLPFTDLSPIYKVSQEQINQHALIGASSLLVTVLLTKKTRKPLLLILLFIACLFPALNIIQASIYGDLIQNRYIGLAVLMVPLALYAFIANIEQEKIKKYLTIILLPFVLFLLIVTQTTIGLWRNDITLWSWSYTENPTSLLSLNNLITGLSKRQQYAAAEERLNILLSHEKSCSTYLTAAQVYLLQKKIEQANHYYDQALNSSCNITQAASIFVNRIHIAKLQKNPQEAILNLNKLEKVPGLTPSHQQFIETMRQQIRSGRF